MQKHRKSLKITAFDGNNSPCFKSCICFKLGHSTQSKKNINLFDNTIIVPPLIYIAISDKIKYSKNLKRFVSNGDIK